YSLGVSFTLNSLLLLFTFIIGHSLNEAIQSFIGLGRLGNHYNLMFVKTISILIPNFDMFNFRLAIIHGHSLAWPQVALSSAYWLFYLCAILTLSAVVLNRRDL
ncbi:MAG: hypothetical protein GXP59_02365, partial [Deltaproteobacteria bacterium]|nr:hypothetical protein [Deltaproteobacteria bacterium]